VLLLSGPVIMSPISEVADQLGPSVPHFVLTISIHVLTIDSFN
jgi:hypothetical protein